MHFTSSISFQYTISWVSLYMQVRGHPAPEMGTSRFPFLPWFPHPRNKSPCVLQPYWKRLEVFFFCLIAAEGKKNIKIETRRHKSPLLLTPEKQWSVESTRQQAYTAGERNSHTHAQNAFKSSCPDVSVQLHVSNVLWAECNRPNKPFLLCRTSAGKWKAES